MKVRRVVVIKRPGKSGTKSAIGPAPRPVNKSRPELPSKIPAPSEAVPAVKRGRGRPPKSASSRLPELPTELYGEEELRKWPRMPHKRGLDWWKVDWILAFKLGGAATEFWAQYFSLLYSLPIPTIGSGLDLRPLYSQEVQDSYCDAVVARLMARLCPEVPWHPDRKMTYYYWMKFRLFRIAKYWEFIKREKGPAKAKEIIAQCKRWQDFPIKAFQGLDDILMIVKYRLGEATVEKGFWQFVERPYKTG